jgi:hypothetical protein
MYGALPISHPLYLYMPYTAFPPMAQLLQKHPINYSFSHLKHAHLSSNNVQKYDAPRLRFKLQQQAQIFEHDTVDL